MRYVSVPTQVTVSQSGLQIGNNFNTESIAKGNWMIYLDGSIEWLRNADHDRSAEDPEYVIDKQSCLQQYQ